MHANWGKPHTSKCIICPLSKCKSLLHDCSYKTHCGCMLWCSPGSTDYICCPHVPMLAQARAHNSPLCVCVSFTGFEILELEVGSNQLLADSSSCCTQLHLLYTHHEHYFSHFNSAKYCSALVEITILSLCVFEP